MYISYFLIHLKGIVHCVEKKKTWKREKKKSPSHGYCETVLCHFVMCPFVYDPCKRVSGEEEGGGRQDCGEWGQEWARPSTLRLAAAPTPSLRKDATSPTTHSYFVPCPPHPGVISPGHQHCLGRAHSLPYPAHSSYPQHKVDTVGKCWRLGGSRGMGSSWGHWNQVLLWIVIVFALFSPSDCISIYTIYLYNKIQCQSFLMQGISPTLQKKNLMDL